MPLKQKIESPRLESYKLNRRLTEIIKVASEYIMTIENARTLRGEPKQNRVLHLYARDYQEINNAIIEQSGKTFDIKSVTLCGWRLERQ